MTVRASPKHPKNELNQFQTGLVLYFEYETRFEPVLFSFWMFGFRRCLKYEQNRLVHKAGPFYIKKIYDHF